MTTDQKEKCRKAYYHSDIEPTLDRLNQIKEIVSNFEKDGANRLTCALEMKHKDLDEIEQLSAFIAQARDKMEKELERLKKFEPAFNNQFATDHNNYYNSVSEVLRHIRSHLSPLKIILKKFCPRKHPSAKECEMYNISPKSVIDASLLGDEVYQPDLFELESFPPAVQGLYNEMIKFFKAEKECMDICTEILQEELAIRKDPIKSKYILDKYRQNAYKRMENAIMLISEDTIEYLKATTPAYQAYQHYASEEGFAQGEFHKQNCASMDHLCLIEAVTETEDITIKEKVLWGNNPKTIKKIRYVISHFDELLPADFKHKLMGMYEYIFSQWALPDNVKQAVEYFIEHYNGNYAPVKYAAVNKHSLEYNKSSEMVKDFISGINVLFANSNNAELMDFSA